MAVVVLPKSNLFAITYNFIFCGRIIIFLPVSPSPTVELGSLSSRARHDDQRHIVWSLAQFWVDLKSFSFQTGFPSTTQPTTSHKPPMYTCVLGPDWSPLSCNTSRYVFVHVHPPVTVFGVQFYRTIWIIIVAAYCHTL